MNKEESLNLYNKGREAWNAWAKEMLARRDKLTETGDWMQPIRGPFVNLDMPGKNQATQEWMDAAKVDFLRHSFEEDADFTNFLFPSAADFTGVLFKGSARFTNAKFVSDTLFLVAQFNGLATFREAVFSADASFSNATFVGSAHFIRAAFAADIRFEGTSFEAYADFMNAKFNGDTYFISASFNGKARFQGSSFEDILARNNFMQAKFNGGVSFVRSSFKGVADFYAAMFAGDVRFNKATFDQTVSFLDVTFIDDVYFTQAVFQDYTSFHRTIFKNDSFFPAIKVQSFFSLKAAIFFSVPDFEQAYFAEAPQLDGVHFQKQRIKSGLLGFPPNSVNRDMAARWRALKRLAIQAHDHERELIFLAEETKSLRGVRDWPLPNPLMWRKGEPICWPGGGRYWFGVFYQGFSDFGRSTFRPFLCWVILIFAFGWIYFYQHSVENIPITTPPNCKPYLDALYLSLHNGLVIPGLGRSETLTQRYDCLYGTGQENVPYPVVFAGLGQTILSAVLIFLFLLALRNYFRIK